MSNPVPILILNIDELPTPSGSPRQPHLVVSYKPHRETPTLISQQVSSEKKCPVYFPVRMGSLLLFLGLSSVLELIIS